MLSYVHGIVFQVKHSCHVPIWSAAVVKMRSNLTFMIVVLLCTRDEDEDEDEELTGGAVEEMRYWGVMGGGRGPVSLTQDQKKQQMEVLMKRPDLCRLIERCVVQQAGDGRPFALLRDLANLSLGPHNQVFIMLDASSVPVSK